MRPGTLLLLLCLLPAGASAQGGPAPDHTFSVLTYNVAGLPEGISGSTPFVNTVQISPLLDAFDLVAVQEDFAYHEDLVSAVHHPHRSVKDTRPGRFGELVGYAFGDGLNTFSRAPFSYFTRITWNDCLGVFSNGSDCLTPKGFSFARVWLERGVFVDVYDWHADAGNAPEDRAVRRANVRQLAAFVASNSAGNAVIVLGDTNSRYTRTGDALPELLATVGLTDVWVELERGGVLPPLGPNLRSGCATNPAGGECERLDKILYRSGAALELTALSTDVPPHFVDAGGAPLSDHRPVSAVFSWRVVSEAPTGTGTGAPVASAP